MNVAKWVVDQVIEYIEALETQLEKKWLLVAGGVIAWIMLLCFGLLLLRWLVS